MTADATGLTGTTPTVTIATTLQGGLFQAPFNDARRGSTNTNDLRGKILRIKVAERRQLLDPARATCSRSPSDVDGKTRPEIYAMGFRNPFRIQVDEDGVAYVSDYSPDSRRRRACARPQGTGRIEIVRKPSNYGWPMCYKTDLPMYHWDFNTQTRHWGRRTSATTRTTGRRTSRAGTPGSLLTPPITNPDVWYSFRDDLWGTPCLDGYNDAVPVQQHLPADLPRARHRRRRPARDARSTTTRRATRARRSSRRTTTTPCSSASGPATTCARSASTRTTRSSRSTTS